MYKIFKKWYLNILNGIHEENEKMVMFLFFKLMEKETLKSHLWSLIVKIRGLLATIKKYESMGVLRSNALRIFHTTLLQECKVKYIVHNKVTLLIWVGWPQCNYVILVWWLQEEDKIFCGISLKKQLNVFKNA